MMNPNSMLAEAEGQIRRGWAEFHQVWMQVEGGWKDQRRLQWEKEVLDRVPGVLSTTTSAISELREAAIKAMTALSDPDRQSYVP